MVSNRQKNYDLSHEESLILTSFNQTLIATSITYPLLK